MLPVCKAPANRFDRLRSSKQLPKLLVLLAAGCLTTMTGGIVSPVLPEIVQQLELDPRWAGLLVSMHALAIAVCTPLFGILADRVGKLKVLIPGLALYAVFGAAGAWMQSFLPLLATRALLGAASGAVAAATIGLLGTMYEGEARSRILGYATSAMTTASILIPLVGGWVGQHHWQYSFYLYGFGLPLAAIAAVLLKEGQSGQSSVIPTGQNQQLLQILRQPRTLQLYLTLALAASVVYSVVIYTPLYLREAIGATPLLNGSVLAVRAIGAAIVSALVASRLAKAVGTERAIALGFTLMSLTLVTIPFLDQLETIMPTAVLFGMGFGVVVPNVYDRLADQAPSELRSSVLAIGTGCNSLGQFISPLALGQVWKYAGLPPVFYVAAAVALGTGLMNLLQRPQDLRQ
jgi:ACDE family multidrug resistance protein